MLDARIASALNKIIQKYNFKKEVSLEEQKAQKEDRFLRGRQIAHMIYDYVRVIGAHYTALVDSPRDHPQRIQSDDVQRNREAVPEAGRTKTVHTSENRLNQGTIPMPTFATKPWTTSSTMPVELSQSHMVGQQRQQISELQFDKCPNPQSFFAGKFDSKIK